MDRIATACRRSLFALSKGLHALARALEARPGGTLAMIALVTAASAFGLTKTRYLFSAQDMVGEGIPSADELMGLRERYEDGTTSILTLAPPEGRFSFSVKQLCAIREWYAVARVTLPQLKNSVATFDVKWPVEIKERTVKYQNVLQLDCDRLKAQNDVHDVKRWLDESPWTELHDREDRLSLVFSFTYKNLEEGAYGSFDPRVVDPLRASVEQDLARLVPGARVSWVGPADYQWYVKKGFQFALVVNAAMIAILLFALRRTYGTWRSGLILCATLVVNGIWIYGLKALTGSPYDILSSGTFLILGVSSIEDFAFLSSEQLKGATWRQAARQLLVPSFFTSLTTVIGFVSLCSSDLAIIRRFGLWCAIGALQEWAMLFLVVPAVLGRYGRRPNWVDPARARARRTAKASLLSAPRAVTLAALLVFPLAALSFARITVDDDPSRAFAAHHPYNEGLRALKGAKGWLGVASLVWDATDERYQATPLTPRLDAAADALLGSGTAVVAVETPNRILDWLAARKTLSREELAADFKSSLQYRQLVDPSGAPRALVYLDDLSIAALERVKAAAARVCPNRECHAAGDLIAYADFSTMVPATLIRSMVESLVLVALVIAFLALAFGKQRLLVQLLASSFWGPCLMVCVLAGLGIPLGFLNCIIASVLVGLTGDNAVQYLFGSGRAPLSRGIAARGAASIVTNGLMALTALAYLLSYFQPPKIFGLLLALGLLAALFGDLWLLNGLLGLRWPRPGPRSAPSPGSGTASSRPR